ncbi:hypothetical protein BpHYR1_006594 [Brachionus plicatilis]|uniref:Uncharacterized protein n=1 Tax=Brachionus plicatilis TaxID=10195 RepID=A0A3M7SF87_BRAPC|nr:hypothetical protein BpHYR1_006594 [Brachionus plicatilis]
MIIIFSLERLFTSAGITCSNYRHFYDLDFNWASTITSWNGKKFIIILDPEEGHFGRNASINKIISFLSFSLEHYS